MAVPNLTPNSPVAGSISWSAFNIQYGGVGYSVSAGSTANKYVWWVYNGGSPSLQSGNTLPTNLTADDIMLFVNKSGIPVNVQASTVIDGSLVVDGTIVGTAIAAGTVHGDRIQGGTLTISQTNGLQAAITGAQTGAVADVKTLWGHPNNTTLIDGGDIYTNSIYAKQLALSDFTNYIADGDLTDSRLGNWGTGLTYVPATSTDPAYIEWTAGNGNNAHRYNLHNFEVKVGDKFYVSFEVSTPATNTVDVSLYGAIETRSVTGTAVTWPQLPAKVLPPNTAWTTHTGVIEVVSNATLQVSGCFNPFAASTAAGQVVRMRRMMLRKMHGGELIVDGAIKAAQLDANAITAKHTLTGPTFQTTATANRGIKIVSSANGAFGSLIAYDAAGAANLTINGQDGSITMKGSLTSGSSITGATITGGTIETEATANRGIKITSTGLAAYNASGVTTLTINAANGGIAIVGSLLAGSNVTGATITGGVVQTTLTANRGIKIVNDTLTAYDAAGNATLTVDGSTGAVAMKGTLTSGSTITGATISGGKVETVAGNGSKATLESGSLKMFSNLAGEVATGGMTAGSWVWNGVTAAQTTLESPRVSANPAGRVRVWQGNDGKAGAEMWASADTSIAVDDTSGLIHMKARAGRILFNNMVKDFVAPVNFRQSFYTHPATASPPDNAWRTVFSQTWIPWPAGASYAHIVWNFPGNTDTAAATDSYYNLVHWTNKDGTQRDIASGYSHNNGGSAVVNMGGTLSAWVNSPAYGATDNYIHLAVNHKATGAGWVALRSGSLNITFFS